MRSRQAVASLLTDPGIIAVVRTPRAAQVLPIAEALVAGGVVAVEVTLTVPGALDAIKQVSGALGARVLVGAGTVLDAKSCKAAI
jgi:2-dehydro-3-deoxyphosphogluconate aldolase/(4S)-4-hydroxy-2-oxoglutarate aldolase